MIVVHWEKVSYMKQIIHSYIRAIFEFRNNRAETRQYRPVDGTPHSTAPTHTRDIPHTNTIRTLGALVLAVAAFLASLTLFFSAAMALLTLATVVTALEMVMMMVGRNNVQVVRWEGNV